MAAAASRALPLTAAPAASAGISAERLRGALLWLTGLSGAFVFVEPSPYELVSLVTIFIFALTGFALRAGTMPLLLLLVLYNVGFSIAVIPVLDAAKTGPWVLISWYLALTALFFAVALADNTEKRLSLLIRGTMAAAMLASVAAVVGYTRVVPEFSDLFLRYDRARGMFNDPNVLGAFLVFPMLVALGRVFAGRLASAVRAAMLVALFSTALLLSFSRGAWGQCAFAAALLMALTFLTGRSAEERLRIVVVAAIGTVLLAGFIAALLSIDSVAALFRERASFDQGYDLGPMGRFGRHTLGILLALDTPLGIGPLQFRTIFPEDPHNAFLNAFMSGGWLSGFSYLTLMLVTLVRGLRYAFVMTPWQRAYLAVYCAFAGAFIESTIIDSEHWRHLFLLLGVLWGLMVASRRYLRTPVPAAPLPTLARLGRTA